MADQDDDVTIICCGRVAELPPDTIVRGATQSLCSKCGAAIWVAPSSYAKIAEVTAAGQTAELLCMECAAQRLKEDEAKTGEPANVLEPAPAQIGEIVRHLLYGSDRGVH